MNFPIFPIMSFLHVDSGDVSNNIIPTAIIVFLAVIVGFAYLASSAKKQKYTRRDATYGFTSLLIAAIFVVFGFYNIVTVGFAIAMLWYVVWKLMIQIVIWRFLIKFVAWRMIVLNARVAITGKETPSKPES